MPFFKKIIFSKKKNIPNIITKELPSPPISFSNDTDITKTKKIDDTSVRSTITNGSVVTPSTSSDQVEMGLDTVSLNKSTVLINKNQNVSGKKRDFQCQTSEPARKKVRFEERTETNKDDKFDDDYHFVMSILPSLRKMEKLNKLKVRMEIIEVLTRKLENSTQEKQSFEAVVPNSPK